MTTLGDVTDFIDEANEAELRTLIDALVNRQKVLRRRKQRQVLAAIEVGSRVQFGSNCKPKYLNYKTGVVERIAESKILVKLDCGPIGKFRSGKVLAHAASLTIRGS